VTRVDVEGPQDNLLSHTFRLVLAYAGEAEGAPASLFVKTAAPDRAAGVRTEGPREIAFYRQIASARAMDVLPRCHEANWNPEEQSWHLVLEDLTESHRIATTWPLPPSLQECQRMVRALAGFHAAWWEDEQLGLTVGVRASAASAAHWARSLGEQFGRFADAAGDGLSKERRALMERFIAEAPRVLAYGEHRPLTVIHGDAHLWNCFLPRNPPAAHEKWFDWDSWRVDLGATDLAYMMAVHWYPERRRRFEPGLLDCYHDALAASGVPDYDRAALQEDYRLAVLRQMATPVRQQAGGLPPLVWWSHLERIFLAVDDLGCRDLLS
jgi:hypothetical protein